MQEDSRRKTSRLKVRTWGERGAITMEHRIDRPLRLVSSNGSAVCEPVSTAMQLLQWSELRPMRASGELTSRLWDSGVQTGLRSPHNSGIMDITAGGTST